MTPYRIGNQVVSPIQHESRDEIEFDPRGVLCMFEPPMPRATYVVGVDPTVGITGWDRELRTEEDAGVDNAAIEVLRVGDEDDPEKPDVQVAEWVGPIDPVDLADVVNAIGRLYCGGNEDGQALVIPEVYPGPGMQTMRRLIDRLGYTNIFVWKYHDSLALKQTGSYGWYSSPKSVRDMWINGMHRMKRRMIRINSPWLVEEMSECEMDYQRMRAKAVYGAHDDRVVSLFIALWAAHEPTGQAETITLRVERGEKPIDWQRSDLSSDDLMSEWEERWNELSEAG